jgi:hypothetical protein
MLLAQQRNKTYFSAEQAALRMKIKGMYCFSAEQAAVRMKTKGMSCFSAELAALRMQIKGIDENIYKLHFDELIDSEPNNLWSSSLMLLAQQRNKTYLLTCMRQVVSDNASS